MADRPDVVLIMTDQQRFDQVGYVSGNNFETPCLDELAGRGVIFDQAYSASTTCIPARIGLLTGLGAHRVPVQPGTTLALREGFWTVARALVASGYQTALVGKMHFWPVDAAHGFDQSFTCEHLDALDRPEGWSEPVDDDYGRWLAARGIEDWRDRPVPPRRGPEAMFPYPIDVHPTSWVTARAVEVLEQRDPDRPLFLVVSYLHPHGPLNPPEPYASRYDPDDAVLPADGPDANAKLPGPFLDALQAPSSASVPDEPTLRDTLARARALVRHVDDSMRDLVERLDLGRTLLAFTSDHGDYGGHRGLLRKNPWIPFDDLTRVPLVLCAPDVARPGSRRADLVQSADFALTCLDYAGVAVATEEFRTRSLRPLLNGTDGPPDRERTLFLATNSGWPAIRRGPHKLIGRAQWANPALVLFDLEADPGETDDLAVDPANAALVDELGSLLDEEMLGPIDPKLLEPPVDLSVLRPRDPLGVDWDPCA